MNNECAVRNFFLRDHPDGACACRTVECGTHLRFSRISDGEYLVQEVWSTENGEEFSDMARGTLAHCLRYVTESVCNAVY